MIWIVLATCAGPPPVIRLPPAPGPYAPSTTVWQGTTEQARIFADVDACAACHPEAAVGWAGSAHAHASFDNPWYRASVDALRDEVGNDASRHCGGCHDPALLLTDALDHPVSPTTPLARVGVPCLGCHGIAEATPEGNGSYTLDLADLPSPTDDLAAHRQRMRPEALGSGDACGACHRGFLHAGTGNATHLQGMDDLGPWGASAYAGSHAARLDPRPVPAAGCIDCHLAGHAFPGGQTALAAQTGGLGALQPMLAQAVQLYAIPRVDGDDLVVDLVVHNVGVGHAFPGGLADAQQIWMSLDVRDAAGVSIATTRGPEDPRTHRLGAAILDGAGGIEGSHRPHRFAVTAWDHTVAAGDARGFRYRIPGAAHAEALSAAIRHRAVPPALAAAACAATAPGTLDGCAPLPEIVVAEVETTLGAPISFDMAYAHGLALAHARQEHLDAARGPLDLALRRAPDRRAEAAVWVVLARIEGRQGRTEAALAAADTALQRFGPHPAIDRARGEALARVWRWPEAAAAFDPLAGSTPRDVATWRDLARSRGSAQDADGALGAATEGLARAPRDSDLLRHQALALRALDDPRWPVAEDAWLAHRPPDAAADLRRDCDRQISGCAEARLPIPTTVVDPHERSTDRSPSR